MSGEVSTSDRAPGGSHESGPSKGGGPHETGPLLGGELSLGPFVLGARLGRGGMGEVFRARPPLGGPDLAVKVLTASRARDLRFQQAFRDEVRAVARLDHPGIIHVFDHGLVSPADAEASAGRLVHGSPWLAMELVEGSTLGRARLSRWLHVQEVLLELLDALAHAHARGLVHRDIKPDNVLLPLEDGHRRGLRLSDFGAVHARDQEVSDNRVRVVGTVAYMPPEQIEGRPRQLGPWTDLYAMGCLAWRLSTGAPVFAERRTAQLLRLQVESEPGPFLPTIPVPAGLEGWLRCLLQKDPRRRYQRAADAAWALRHLREPELRPTRSVQIPRLEGGETMIASGAGMSTGMVTLVFGPAPPDAAPDRSQQTPLAPAPYPSGARYERGLRPPLPQDWRRPAHSRRPLRPGGVGTGLFGLRTAPFVGREAARDLLWAAAHEAITQERMVFRLVTGPAGVGKSRLVEAVATQLHELGAATVLRAHHDPGAAATAGLVPALARHLRCQGLRPSAYWTHLEGVMARLRLEDPDNGLRLALVRLLDPTTLPALQPPPKARRALLGRVLAAEARLRPIVLLLDDVDRGASTLHTLRALAELTPSVPMVVLCTARADAEHALPTALTQLVEASGTPAQHLPPLPPRSTRILVQELLELDMALTERVVARAEGNPLFATQLIADWVAGAQLEPGPTGFDLRPGAAAGLPDDLHALWQRRLAALAEPEQRLLRLAAVLGRSVDPTTWAAAAERLDLPLPDRVIEVMLAQGLMVRDPLDAPFEGASLPPLAEGHAAAAGLVRFPHGLLVESLERAARDSGELALLHQACAEVLAPEAAQPSAKAAAVARHAQAAGLLDLAIDALFSAARHHHRTNEGSTGLAQLDRREALLDRHGASSVNPRRIRGWSLRSEMERLYGHNPEGVRWGERALEAAREAGHPDMLVETAVALANAWRHAARLEDARGLLEEVAALTDEVSLESRAIAHRILGDLLIQLGAIDEALEHARHAEALLTEAGDTFGLGCTQTLLGRIHYLQGDLASAAAHADRARALLHPLGYLFHEANAAGLQGEVLRARGDLEAAARAYAESARLYELAGSAADSVSMLNLAMVEVLRGRYAEARQLSEEVDAAAGRTGHAIIGLFARTVGFAGLAEDGRWTELETELDALVPTFTTQGIVDPDVATSAWIAGERAHAHGETGWARRLWGFSRAQWSGLHRDDKVREVDAALDALPAADSQVGVQT